MLYITATNVREMNQSRGGTEEIYRRLIESYNLVEVDFKLTKNIKFGVLFCVGFSFFNIVKTIIFKNFSLVIVKTATYSKYRNIFESLLYTYIISRFAVVAVLTEGQQEIYQRSVKLDLLHLYGIKKVPSCELERNYKYGYVGRIDIDKGYSKAVELMESLSINNTCVLDILIWDDAELKYLPSGNKNLDVRWGNKSKGVPPYSEIKNLILPYKSLSSTIAFPLVVLEALVNGCCIYTSAEVAELAANELPAFSHMIFSIQELQDHL